MKKIFFPLLSLVFIPVLFTSCLQEYSPTKLSIASEKSIARKVRNTYRKYGTFTETSCETSYIRDMYYADLVDEKYQDNVASRILHFECSALPGIDIVAVDKVCYVSASEFGDWWEEDYYSDFPGYFYENQTYDYYKKLLDNNFSSYDYKMISKGVQSYPLSPIASTFNSFEDYLENGGSQVYYVAIKHADDSTMDTLMESFKYQLRSVESDVTYYLVFDDSVDLDSITSVEDITKLDSSYYENICYSYGANQNIY